MLVVAALGGNALLRRNQPLLQRIPSTRTIARLMTIGRNNLSKADTVTITAIEAGVPRLAEAREA